MSIKGRRLLATLLLTGQAVAASYVAFVTWLLAVWMVSENVAVGMTPRDWYFGAVERGLIGLGIAAGFGALVYPVNRWCLAAAAQSRPRIALHVSLGFAAVIEVAALIGSVQFAVQKPWF